MRKLYVKLDDENKIIRGPHPREEITDWSKVSTLQNGTPVLKEYVDIKPSFNKITQYLSQSDPIISDFAYAKNYTVQTYNAEELSNNKTFLKNEARRSLEKFLKTQYETEEKIHMLMVLFFQFIVGKYSSSDIQELLTTGTSEAAKTLQVAGYISQLTNYIIDSSNPNSIYYKIDNEDDSYTLDFDSFQKPDKYENVISEPFV